MRAWVIAGALLSASTAQAALEARDLDWSVAGHEAVHDTVQNITWLADAQVFMGTWNQVTEWASNLTVGNASGWRLATGSELFGLYNEWRDTGIALYGADFIMGIAPPVETGPGSPLFINAGERSWFDGTPGAYTEILDFNHAWTDSSGGCLPDTCIGYGWAVHAGSIPEPATYAMVLAGLLTVVVGVRRTRT